MALMKWREKNQARWFGVRPAHNGTQVVKSGAAVNQTATIHTVTAGKTLYLFNDTFTADSRTLINSCSLFVTNDADVIQYYLYNIPLATQRSLAVARARYVPLEIPSGWKIKVSSSVADGTVCAEIEGVEE